LSKFNITQHEYDRLCSFALDRSTAQYIKDAFEGCDYGWDDWDEVIALGEAWELNRDMWRSGFQGEETLKKREKLVKAVYGVIRNEA
jgi:hypothetical protein